MRTTVLLTFVALAVPGISSSARSQTQTAEVRKAAILTAISESATSQVTLIKDRLGADQSVNINFDCSYGDEDFRIHLYGSNASGDEINVRYTGHVLMEANNNMSISFAGTGSIGKDPLRSNGNLTWLYSNESNDYRSIDFQMVTKFGDHSVWGWVLGAETIVGGTIGGGGAAATALIASDGAAIGLIAWITAGGAGAGAAALISASDASKNLLEASEQPPPPVAPARPVVPSGKIQLVSEGKIFTAISRDGTMFASSNGQVILNAAFDNKEGYVKGGITSSEKALK
jgi:hypothetical protein